MTNNMSAGNNMTLEYNPQPRLASEGVQMLRISEPKNNFVSLSYEQIGYLSDRLAKSTIIPLAYRGKPDDIFVAILRGQEIKMHPLQSLEAIGMINGKSFIYGDAVLTVARQHPNFVSIKESYDDATEKATCIVVRRGEEPHVRIMSMDDAKKAGWYDKGYWAKEPKHMLQIRTRNRTLRAAFSDALMGMICVINEDEAKDWAESEDDALPMPLSISMETVNAPTIKNIDQIMQSEQEEKEAQIYENNKEIIEIVKTEIAAAETVKELMDIYEKSSVDIKTVISKSLSLRKKEIESKDKKEGE